MCGITGIINLNNKPVQDLCIKLMMQKIKHRGPDDEGIFIDNNVGLGFVRLSILDLSQAGHQPMFSEDGRYVIIFNGEVYNYIEIKDELKTKYKYKTGTDTEVILTAYQEWKEKCLERFNGMFAFVIYDIYTKEIFIARDRFGIKPLYYYQDENKFIFSSEIKSILPFIEPKVNEKIIYDYLLFNRTDHTGETFFKNIKKLQHGSYLKINKNRIDIFVWYNLKDRITSKNILPIEYWQLFQDSLKLRLRADVPIGVSLSGGIDSSSIVASLIKNFKLTELNTFSVVFGPEESSDESIYINEFKSMLKNKYYINPDANTFFHDFEDFIETHNEPVPDTGPYVQFKVMELASKYVKVTLDGQGADEQLAGYHYFFGSYYIELLKKFNILKLLIEAYEYYKKHYSFDAYKYMFYYLMPSLIQEKLNKNIYPSINNSFIESQKTNTQINNMLYNPQSLNNSLIQHFDYKLEHLLKWEDLNSMHFSIESRVPFLDYRLVEATLSTPSHQKIKNGETKYLLRQAMKGILPNNIFRRKDKKGFSSPRDKWLKSEQFQKYIFDMINSESFKQRGYFNYKVAIDQYKKHLDGQIDASKEIWKWINLEIWFDKFICS